MIAAMTASFYDQLAPYYHLLYEDWENAIVAQGAALSELLQRSGVLPGQPVLDAASGIGTQTIGLLQHGYVVSASDISPQAIERLREELSHRALHANTCVDDLLTLRHTRTESMAAVLACDNVIPHFLSDVEILEAFRSCRRCLRPGGVAIVSVRDYARVVRVSPDVRPYGLRHKGGARFLAVQVWEWHGHEYDLRLYLTSESADGLCRTQVLTSRYYAVTIDRLLALMTEAGLVNVRRHDDVLFQPVLVGRK
jgi:SAM-dependent methyltransferase